MAISKCLPTHPDVVVTDGGHPVQWCIAGHVGAMDVLPPPRVVDTTGAGDTFAGGVLYHLTRGCDLAEATARSHPLAAAVVSQYGARLSHDELQTLSAS